MSRSITAESIIKNKDMEIFLKAARGKECITIGGNMSKTGSSYRELQSIGGNEMT